ncbi:hypothetical protein EC843_104128 [Buttiauxella sp. JUb87]|uniref:hypothetical protein n=1 Tax=Buttiauxella sp. JUb87 TaxID=2485129 RepID=UPI0010621FB5|nr:hypothetical protein [Buttiauxella sp. JUb87]TDN51117.1 hypothetical protein EC843_104128 [Buttiauxella sp. JUb87]
MGVVSSNFKATVTFGGVVSNSFKSSSKTLTEGITDAEMAVARLTKKQEVLAQKIKKGTLAGKDVSRLKREYTELGKSIEEANRDAEQLNRTLRIRQVLTAPLRGAAGIGKAGLGAAMSGAGPLFGVATGLVGGALAINATTAEQAGVAKGYGVSLNKFKAWDAVGKQIGMNGEAFGDLAEELSNKIGEFKALGEQSSVSDAFTGLGITSSSLTGKTNEEQMALILNRALEVKDEQVARSMIDMVMGGEGNKILAYMKMSGKTYEELMSAQEKYILTTKKGEEGAVRGQMAMSSMWTALSSAAQEVIGTLAGDLAPSITKYADEFSSWFRTGGKDILVEGISGFATSISDFWESQLKPVLSALWRGLQVLADFIGEYFADYETKFEKANNLTEVGRAAVEEGERLAEKQGINWLDTDEFVQNFAKKETARWQAAQITKQSAQQTGMGTAYENYDLNGQERTQNAADSALLNILNDANASKNAERGMPTLQQFPFNITVQAASGDDAMTIGKKVGEAAINVFKLSLGDSGIMTPPTLGG